MSDLDGGVGVGLIWLGLAWLGSGLGNHPLTRLSQDDAR